MYRLGTMLKSTLKARKLEKTKSRIPVVQRSASARKLRLRRYNGAVIFLKTSYPSLPVVIVGGGVVALVAVGAAASVEQREVVVSVVISSGGGGGRRRCLRSGSSNKSSSSSLAV